MDTPEPFPKPDESILREIVRSAHKNRLGLGLIQVAWIHLAIFGVCEVLFLQGDRSALHFLPLWFSDVAATYLLLRSRLAHPYPVGSISLTRVAVRIWLTFTILCFTSASLNSLTGFQIDWFKISWCILGTFAFACMAWIFHLAFLILAVQMSVTGLLVASYPNHGYLILGLSGFLALHGLGLLLERPRWSAIATGRAELVARHQ